MVWGPRPFSLLQSCPSYGLSSSCPCHSLPYRLWPKPWVGQGLCACLLSGLDTVQGEKHVDGLLTLNFPGTCVHSHRPEGSPRPGPPRMYAMVSAWRSHLLGTDFFPSSFAGCQLVWADNLNSVSSSMKRGRRAFTLQAVVRVKPRAREAPARSRWGPGPPLLQPSPLPLPCGHRPPRRWHSLPSQPPTAPPLSNQCSCSMPQPAGSLPTLSSLLQASRKPGACPLSPRPVLVAP